MGAARVLTPLAVREIGDGDEFEVRRKDPSREFEIFSDSIPDGEEIDQAFVYPRHDPFGLNKQPHLALKGLRADGSTCGVVIIHDKKDPDKWCHGVFVFEEDEEIEEDAIGSRRKIKRVIKGINDLHRNERGEKHNTTQEEDPDGMGYIGCYPAYDTSKSQAKQETHLYHFDGYEVEMTVKELLFAVIQVTRKKLGEALLIGNANDYAKKKLMEMAVLTKENVEEAIAEHIINKSPSIGTYKNPGWLDREWAGPRRFKRRTVESVPGGQRKKVA